MLEGTAGRVSRIGRTKIARPSSRLAIVRHLDPVLTLTALALTGFGLVMIYSASFATLRDQGSSPRYLLDKQITFAMIGILAAVVVAAVDYRRLRSWSGILYTASLVLLIAVLSPIGRSNLGAQRWINVGPLPFQPSEITKIAVILLLAAMLAQARGAPDVRDVVRCVLVVAIPALLIYRQPDLGTLLVLMAILAGVLLASGTRLRVLVVMLLLGGVATVGVLHIGLLKDYQVHRLTAFLDPSADPGVTGYNLNQAKIAVGSGQISGKGLFHGTQTNLDFVPEQHTDFIFTAVGEETGFAGSAVLLVLFAVFLWRGVRIAMLSKDLFGTLIAAGVVAMVMFQIYVNIGMTIGVSPITGIPLPFVSYGGSSLITTFMATGLLQSVHMRRY